MQLSSELISQFVKATNDTTNEKPVSVVYGTVEYDAEEVRYYVRLDGSDIRTPISQTADVKDGDRVTVMIKDHSATVTGNVTSPAARKESVTEVADQITNFEVIMAHKVSTDDLQAINAIIEALRVKLADIDKLTASEAEIEALKALFADVEHLTADDITAITAQIERLEAIFGEFTDISTEDLDALNAEITNLRGYTADFTYVSAEVLEAVKASIKQLEVDKLSVKEANLKYVTIDFSNIDEAWMNEFYAKSGLIEELVAEDATITKYLVGVKIIGDLIEAGTLQADKLVVKGDDGLYYRLNFESGQFTSAEEVPADGLHGSVIIAESITADKVRVSDLSAFEATIGGFTIAEQSLYSGVKASVDNTTPGAYMDSSGQFAIGNDYNYLKFYKLTDTDGNDVLDEDGNPVYKLEISAESILFGANSKTSAADLKALTEHVKIGVYREKVVDEDGNEVLDDDGNPTYSEEPSVELAEGDSDFKQVITNAKTMFMDGDAVKTRIDAGGVKTTNLNIDSELRQAGFVWAGRANGNYGLSWNGGVS